MPNPIWPTSLPQAPLRSDYREAGPSAILRSETDTGPAIVRRRFTAASRRREVTYRMSEAQLEIFETFFDQTIAGGSLRFDWPDARRDQTVEARMRIETGNEPYTVAGIGAGWYDVTFVIEILP